MTAKFKKMRTAGVVPPDYDGPVYWRVMQYHLVSGASDEPIAFTDDPARLDRLWIDWNKMPGKSIFTSGTVFDEDGAILPEWKQPIKAKWTKPGPVRVEYSPGRYSARVSERVLDAIESVEPGRHHVFPIDVRCTDGTIERRYQIFFAQDAFVDGIEAHPVANALEPLPKPVGVYRFRPPTWLYAFDIDEDQFGYLDRSVVGGMRWFKGTATNHYFSPDLFSKLRPMGNIFPKWDVALPIGMAADPPNLDPLSQGYA
ncbi:hypothetical protein [Methylobacterium sp. Leaf93]|uniref:hypothetical protein n=1 Tax=Methylobacterium sp. Leaf93 TaxID=1736249 RepID=UPI0006F5F4F2|nr:hypothetical protein [Methylobacterium sp. Leaf93]KQP13454.1 hypothetical protein ASF26_18965 [Methylobacterium sp. Leaf93]